jgi:hypothetical protein
MKHEESISVVVRTDGSTCQGPLSDLFDLKEEKPVND